MKKLTIIACILVSFSLNSQVNFGFGITQNFGNIYANNENYPNPNFTFKNSSTCASFFLSREKDEDGWFPELKIDVSVVADTSTILNGKEIKPIEAIIYEPYSTQVISRKYDYGIAAYRTTYQSVQLTMNRRLTNYFSIGGGLAVDIRNTQFVDLNGDLKYDYFSTEKYYLLSAENLLKVNEYDLRSFNVMVPFNFKFYLSNEKADLVLGNSFMFGLNNRSYYQLMLGFRF